MTNDVIDILRKQMQMANESNNNYDCCDSSKKFHKKRVKEKSNECSYKLMSGALFSKSRIARER